MNRAPLTLVLVAMLVGACGSAPKPVASHSPAIPSAAATSGGLNCRLPVAGFVISAPKGQPDNSIGPDGQDNQKGTGGFLEVATGKFTPDVKSDRTYLASAKQWLPVTMQAVSPDQRSYVLNRLSQHPGAAPTASMVLVQIATKSERPLFTAADGQLAFVLAFTSRGIYVDVVSTTGPGPSELLLIDPATGVSHAVAGAQTPPGVTYSVFTSIFGDFAWGTRITGSQQQPSYQLVRLDLTDGTVVLWNRSATTPYFVIGFDADGHPIVAAPMTAPNDPQGVLLLTAPNKSTPVPVNGGSFLQGRGNSVTDAHGTWFGSADGSIWLYSSTTGLSKVASIPPQPGGTGQPYDQHAWRSVAGPCT